MTFTEQELQKGKALHAELKEVEERRRAHHRDFDVKCSYNTKKDEVRSFWLRHGEAVLDALEAAREDIEALRGVLRDIHYASVDVECACICTELRQIHSMAGCVLASVAAEEKAR